MLKRKICIVTGTRAEYGLLRWVMHGVRGDQDLELQLVVTGMHLSPEFGLTYREIEKDGFAIDRKVEMLLSSDTSVGIGKSMGLGMVGFADAFADLQPDLLVLLGDRYEIFCAAAAAMVARIPIAHIHGGEATEGLIDEAIRHCISKMSHFHFVATEQYRRRVIQLGEEPARVYNVGAPGLDGIDKIILLNRLELEKTLGIQFGERNLMVTFHPVTLEMATGRKQLEELLAALNYFKDIHIIFTFPNADTDGRILISMVNDFVKQRSNAWSFSSLGQQLYLSCLQQVDGVVGNSSSGLIEAPSFRKGTINIGDRQRGRTRAGSVIDCLPERGAIIEAISRLYDDLFQSNLKTINNPYGGTGASEKIIKIIKESPCVNVLKKTFYDIDGVHCV